MHFSVLSVFQDATWSYRGRWWLPFGTHFQRQMYSYKQTKKKNSKYTNPHENTILQILSAQTYYSAPDTMAKSDLSLSLLLRTPSKINAIQSLDCKLCENRDHGFCSPT